MSLCFDGLPSRTRFVKKLLEESSSSGTFLLGKWVKKGLSIMYIYMYVHISYYVYIYTTCQREPIPQLFQGKTLKGCPSARGFTRSCTKCLGAAGVHDDERWMMDDDGMVCKFKDEVQRHVTNVSTLFHQTVSSAFPTASDVTLGAEPISWRQFVSCSRDVLNPIKHL